MFLSDLNNYLLINHHTVSIIASRKTVKYFASLENLNFISVKAPNNPFIRVLFFQFSMPSIFKKAEPDIIFSPLEIAYKSKNPNVVYVHDIISKHYLDFHPGFRKVRNIFLWRRIRQSLKYADLVLTPSEFTKNEIKRFLNRKLKFGVVKEGCPNGFIDKFELNVDFSKKTIFIPSYKAIHKPIHQLVLALRVIQQTQPELLQTLQLIFSGNVDDEFEKIKSQILNICNKIKILCTGFIESEKINYIYSKVDAVLFITDYEGFGLPMIEADYFGVPIIATDLPVLREIKNANTFFYKKNDIYDLSKTLIKVITLKQKFEPTYNRTWGDFNDEIFQYFELLIKKS